MEIESLINYYARERMYRNIQTVCSEVLKKRGNDVVLQFWRAFGLACEGSTNEAIRTFENLLRKRDAELAVVMALIHTHGQAKLVDHQAVSALEDQVTAAENRAGENGLLLAATYLWHVGDHARARQFVQRAQEVNSRSAGAATLRGWVDLTAPVETRSESRQQSASINFFEQALSNCEGGGARAQQMNKRYALEALLGSAKYYTLIKSEQNKPQYAKALEALNQVVVMHAWFLPALSEKAKLLMMMGDWDQALETAQRVLNQDATDIEALRVCALHMLSRESRPSDAAQRIDDLLASLDRYEPKNPMLYYNVSRPFARLAGRDPQVLKATFRLVERALALAPDDALYATEAGYQRRLMGEYSDAMRYYSQGSKLDESNMEAIHGMIYCYIMQNQLEDAEGQLEFLAVIQDTVGKTAAVTFLSALLAWRKDKDLRRSMKLLDETMQLHIKALKEGRIRDTYSYYVRFNPDFLLEIAGEYLQHNGSEPADAAEAPNLYVTKGGKLLEKITRQVPGLMLGQLLLARSQFVRRQFGAARQTLSQCLKLNPSNSDAHLVLAQISLHEENFGAAQQALEQAVAHNFEVRDNPLYHILKAKVLEATGDIGGAERMLENAINLPGVRRSGAPGNRAAPNGRGIDNVSLHDRVTIFLSLASVKCRFGDAKLGDAAKILADAMRIFSGTKEEVRVIVATSKLYVRRGDVKRAIRLLDALERKEDIGAPAYTKALMEKASILLEHRRDYDGYTQCYAQLVQRNQSPHSYVLLGEAYMHIQQPDAAIEAFEEALRLTPNDSSLTSRIGKALVSTHDYHRAIEYYESALKSSTRSRAGGAPMSQLRFDLATLYFRLGNFDDAIATVEAALELNAGQGGRGESLAALTSEVRNLKLLSRVYLGAGHPANAVDTLHRARDVQSKAMGYARSEGPGIVREQRLVAAEICSQLAAYYAGVGKDDAKAIDFYNEAQRHDDGNVPAMLALAKLYLRRGEIDKCQHQCVTLMRIDESNEDASMMLADLMFQKSEFDASIYHFELLLEKKPSNYDALARLTELFWRAGNLEKAERFIKLAEHEAPRAFDEPGFRFCKGLFLRFSNNVRDAVTEFNAARRDVLWGQRALSQMIEIYLNPDNADIWDDDGLDGGTPDQMEAINVAERLLREVPESFRTTKHDVLECYALMSTKSRQKIERAMKKIVKILENDRDYVPACLAMATAFMMLKQAPKARQQLKRIAKMAFSQQSAAEFEKSWLLLADIYISNGKYDLAQDLCRRCLQYNKSCSKAWELLGTSPFCAACFSLCVADVIRALRVLIDPAAAIIDRNYYGEGSIL